MRTRRIRPTIGRMMLAIALLAGGLGWAIARPYPGDVECSGFCWVFWSDGTISSMDGGPNPCTYHRAGSWLLIVDWPDGSSGFYLTVRPFLR